MCHTLNVKTFYSLTHFQTESGLLTVWYSSIEAPQHLKRTSRDAENCDCYNHRALKETKGQVKDEMSRHNSNTCPLLGSGLSFPSTGRPTFKGDFLNEILAVSMTLLWDHLRRRGIMWWVGLFHADTSGRAKTKRFYNISRISTQIQESQSVQTRTWMWNKSYLTCRTCV